MATKHRQTSPIPSSKMGLPVAPPPVTLKRVQKKKGLVTTKPTVTKEIPWNSGKYSVVANLQHDVKQALAERDMLNTKLIDCEVAKNSLAKDFHQYRNKYGEDKVLELEQAVLSYQENYASLHIEHDRLKAERQSVGKEKEEIQASLSLANESLRLVTHDHQGCQQALNISRNEVDRLRIENRRLSTDLSAIERSKPEAKAMIAMTVKNAALESSYNELLAKFNRLTIDYEHKHGFDWSQGNEMTNTLAERDFIRELSNAFGYVFAVPDTVEDKVKTIIRAYAANAYKQRLPVKEYQRALKHDEWRTQQTCKKCGNRVYAGEEVIMQGGDHAKCPEFAPKLMTPDPDIWQGKDGVNVYVPGILKELQEAKREVKMSHDDVEYLGKELKAAQNVARRLEERRDSLPKVAETNEVKHLRIIECDVTGVDAIQNMLGAFIAPKAYLEVGATSVKRNMSTEPVHDGHGNRMPAGTDIPDRAGNGTNCDGTARY